MKIGVIGGGIFGVSIAIVLAKNNFDVTIFEKEKDIMMAASFVNQYRVHRGYHYPRSEETILSCFLSEPKFKKEYEEAIISKNKHYYLVSKEKSFLKANQCSEIWKKFNLEHEEAHLDIINNKKIEKCFIVNESLIDPKKWREICWKKLKKYRVKTFLNTEAQESYFNSFDFIIIATYASSNSLLKVFQEKMIDYQFELIEKPLVRLPAKYNGKSMVVIDGPFMCIDPFGDSGLFLMGNVEQAIYKRNIGRYPEIPKEFLPILNKGIIKNPPITKIQNFLESAEDFFPGIKNEAEHIGSMYTIRTILPYREHDDSRPTIINRINNKIITVFSGKIPACIDTAEKVLEIIKNKYLVNTQKSIPIIKNI